MTKLGEWLFALLLFFTIYGLLVTGQVKHPLVEKFIFEIKILPIILIILLGVYAVTTVLYRTFTFNECKDAEKELRKQIEEAKQDLTTKGFKFQESKKDD